jgi:hypothetical protein
MRCLLKSEQYCSLLHAAPPRARRSALFWECLYHRLFVSFQLINIPECPVPDTAEP